MTLKNPGSDSKTFKVFLFFMMLAVAGSALATPPP
jgi:hypothetical protein